MNKRKGVQPKKEPKNLIEGKDLERNVQREINNTLNENCRSNQGKI